MEKTIKMCPLLSVGREKMFECERERCAWWTPCSECAIVSIAHMNGNVSDMIRDALHGAKISQ